MKNKNLREKITVKMCIRDRNNGDMYINGQITKEQYMGLVNMVWYIIYLINQIIKILLMK